MWAGIEDTTWPLPSESMDDLEWRLRYTDAIVEKDRIAAATIVSAYRALVMAGSERRRKVGAELKRRAKKLAKGLPVAASQPPEEPK